MDLFYPLAKKTEHKLKTKGPYAHGYPMGAVIHFTAGRDNPEGVLQEASEKGYAYLLIDRAGTVYQNFPINERGDHAGKSFWPKVGEWVSNSLVGIEIISAGKLMHHNNGACTSWFNTVIPPEEVRYCRATGNIEHGHYHIFTEAQEESLLNLLKWLKNNSPDIFTFDLVLGHDEVSKGRKNDPGGALSFGTMQDFRDYLKKINGEKDV